LFRGEIINVRGTGMRKTFTVRKVSEGVGVERTFPLHGPSVAEIKVIKHAKVRRAKLFYLRRKAGKAARLTEGRAQEEGGRPCRRGPPGGASRACKRGSRVRPSRRVWTKRDAVP